MCLGNLVSFLHQPDNRPSDDPQLENDDSPPDEFVETHFINPVWRVNCDTSVSGELREGNRSSVVQVADMGIEGVTECFGAESLEVAMESESVNRNN